MLRDRRIIPAAIVVLSGGSRASADAAPASPAYASTTYADRDEFGTLGGHARVAAAALLARSYPNAYVITTSKRAPDEPTHAAIIAAELERLGIAPERILLEEDSTSTLTQIAYSLALMERQGLSTAIFVTNAYHVARVRATLKSLHQRDERTGIEVEAAEPLLEAGDPGFAAEFARVRESEPYRERLEAEARGVAALRDGTYRSESHAHGRKSERDANA